MTDIRKILKFNHNKGIIEFTPNKISDVFVIPTFENLRHIGKVTRYFLLKYVYGINCRKIFGTTFIKYDKNCFTNPDLNTNYIKVNSEHEKNLLIIDICVGIIIYMICLIMILSLKNIIFIVIVIYGLLKFLNSKKYF